MPALEELRPDFFAEDNGADNDWAVPLHLRALGPKAVHNAVFQMPNKILPH
jgi:hypothetical protein